MEIKEIEIEGVRYEVVNTEGFSPCPKCCFYNSGGECIKLFPEGCSKTLGSNSYLKKKELSKTELTVQIPEGMEIDKENSTFEFIKFKPKSLTYENVQKKSFPYTHCVTCNRSHVEKLEVYRKLLEVADYLNGVWKPDWNNQCQTKYIITFNHDNHEFRILARSFMDTAFPPFKSADLAKQAIEIIGESDLKILFE